MKNNGEKGQACVHMYMMIIMGLALMALGCLDLELREKTKSILQVSAMVTRTAG